MANNNPPASYVWSGSSHEGWADMSLRDCFALAGIVAAAAAGMHSPEVVADWAYRVADAMIEERRKEGER